MKLALLILTAAFAATLAISQPLRRSIFCEPSPLAAADRGSPFAATRPRSLRRRSRC